MLKQRWKITFALPEDESAIKQLLGDSALPSDDITAEHLQHFFVYRDRAGLAGVVGLEPRGKVGLLRSVAVRADYRDREMGKELIERAEEHARELGIDSLYLLTTTTDRFFAQRGYQITARESAPESIRATTEFASICPASSICMVRKIE